MPVKRFAPRMAALATVLAPALLIAACGGGGPTTVPTQATPTDPGLPSFDIPTFDLGSFALPSFALPSFAGDEELEAMLPDSIGEQTVIKQSLTGQDFINLGMGGAAALEDMLTEMGASIDDLSVAIGSAGGLVVFAYQIEGQSAEQVFDGLEAALQAGGGGTVSDITVGGRSVIQVTTPAETTYIYLASGVVFIIGGTVTPELLEDAVTQLPAG
jgi:hypothetical protein